MKKQIIFLIRSRLGLEIGEHFRFTNQYSKLNTYYFTEDALMKHVPRLGIDYRASVSLNWLLDDECEIEKVVVED